MSAISHRDSGFEIELSRPVSLTASSKALARKGQGFFIGTKNAFTKIFPGIPCDFQALFTVRLKSVF